MADNLPFIIFTLSAILLCIFMILIGFCLGEKTDINVKKIPFESGIDPIESTRLLISIKFYVIAVFFVIFDVEGLYLYIWSIVIRETAWLGFFEVTIFISTLLSSLIYLIRIGALKSISYQH